MDGKSFQIGCEDLERIGLWQTRHCCSVCHATGGDSMRRIAPLHPRRASRRISGRVCCAAYLVLSVLRPVDREAWARMLRYHRRRAAIHDWLHSRHSPALRTEESAV